MTQETSKRPTVEEVTATFGDLDDKALQKLHDDEKGSDDPRTTLLDAIHREQETRRSAAEADKAKAAEADADAEREGFADAKAKQASEDAAKKSAARKRKPAAKRKPAERGFDRAAQDPKALEALRDDATAGGTAKLTLGTEKGPDRDLSPVDATLARKRQFAVSRDKVTFSAAPLGGARTFTHAYVMDGDSATVSAELPAPIHAQPGEQIQFPAGAIAF